MRKVAGEADKLRQLGKLISRLRRPGIVYCATVRAVDELYVALRHGKIPVERYNGKMTTEEREKAQASFMEPGRKVVMIATNAFGLGIDKPDIRYIIHYQMPGSPEAYVQEAGRAGRDGKPARCVLLFQPDDISIQEHFLKEAHPTKAQARMVAEGLYAWSDEGKEVSVRDLAMSMALPERRVRVILSVLEAMGVAEEIKAARWKGVDPRPSREQIDKAAQVFEARRISDRRRLDSLLKYMNTQRCRVQMLRAYFGEPEGEKCGLCDSDAGLDSEVFDTASADERHGLHAATDFHACPAPPSSWEKPATIFPRRRSSSRSCRPRRSTRRRFRPTSYRRCRRSSTRPSPNGRARSTRRSGSTPTESTRRRSGEVVIDPADDWAAAPAPDARAEAAPTEATRTESAPTEAPAIEAAPADGDAQPPAETGAAPPLSEAEAHDARWVAIRDANIRPYLDWRPAVTVALPPLTVRPGQNVVPRSPQPQHHPGQQQHRDRGRPGYSSQGPRPGSGGGGGGSGGGRRRRGRDRDRDRDRLRGRHQQPPPRPRPTPPRACYNPGGD